MNPLSESRANPPAEPAADRRLRVAADRLAPGMWVVELDRPWLDTPFMVSGFRIADAAELDTLRRFCRHAWIDPERSDSAVVDALLVDAPRSRQPDADPWLPGARDVTGWPTDFDPTEVEHITLGAADWPRPTPLIVLSMPPSRPPVAVPASVPVRPLRARADVRISDETRTRFAALVHRSVAGAPRDARPGGGLSRALGWLRRGGDTGRDGAMPAWVAEDGGPPSRDVVQAWLPGLTLNVWEDRLPMERAVPLARRLHLRADALLRGLCRDVAAGRLPRLAPVREVVGEMAEALIDNVDAMVWVSRLHGGAPDAHGHGVQVAVYLMALGRHLGMPRTHLSHLGMIGMLADVGKARLPAALLAKPGMLSPAEFSIVREHVQLGLDALSLAEPLPPEVEQGIAQHHERLDGSGYPLGLKGAQIGIYGRMAAIADSFAALVAPRPYAMPQAPQDALMSLYEWAGTGFHEPLLEQFLQAVGVFPVGSLVELSSGEIAVVIAQHRGRRLEPRVIALTTPDRDPRPVPVRRDLRAQPGERREAGPIRILRGLPWGAYGLQPRDDLIEAARPAGLR